MEIRFNSKYEKCKVKDLPLMRPSLVFEDGDYYIYIRTTINNQAIIIGNASNCREIMITHTNEETEVNFVKEISNFDITNLE